MFRAKLSATVKSIRHFTRLAVALPRRTENGELTFWLADGFGRQAEYLLKHQKGDLISVSGNMVQPAGAKIMVLCDDRLSMVA